MGRTEFDLVELYPEVVVYEGSQEWSALFVNGERRQIGDHYLTDEAIRELFGVKTIQSDDFLLGGDGSGRDGTPPPARTLAEVEAYTAERTAREVRAGELRAEAARLVAEANALDGR